MQAQLLLLTGALLLVPAGGAPEPIHEDEGMYRSDSDPQKSKDHMLCGGAVSGTYVCDPDRKGVYIYCPDDHHSVREEVCPGGQVFDNSVQICVGEHETDCKAIPFTRHHDWQNKRHH